METWVGSPAEAEKTGEGLSHRRGSLHRGSGMCSTRAHVGKPASACAGSE